MATNTVNAEYPNANVYWNLLKGLSPDIKLELIARLSSSLVKKEEHEESSHWTDSFAGKWQDTRSVDEMVADIRVSRSCHKE
jgi:hypothetical protein